MGGASSSVSASPPSRTTAGRSELDRELNELRTALVAFDESSGGWQSRRGSTTSCLPDPGARPPPSAAHGRRSRACRTVIPVRDLVQTEATWVVFIQSERRQYASTHAWSDVELVDLEMSPRSSAPLPMCMAVCRCTYVRRLGIERDRAPILNAAAHLDGMLFAGFDRIWDRIVVCPVGTAYDLPWGLLPTLRDVPFVLTPSITAYLRCQRIQPVEPKRMVAVAGPGLGSPRKRSSR